MTRDPRDEAYDAAQVCVNGHLITTLADSHPEGTSDRCDRCGAETIKACPSCSSIVRGHQRNSGVIGFRFPIPAFCHSCGEPYPWTQAKIRAAKDLAQLMEGSPEDKKLLEASIDDLVRDTPAATVAAVRFKGLVAKGGKAVVDAFRDILVDVLSEAVKKSIWPEAPPSRRR
jgi:hypothetical protein